MTKIGFIYLVFQITALFGIKIRVFKQAIWCEQLKCISEYGKVVNWTDIVSSATYRSKGRYSQKITTDLNYKLSNVQTTIFWVLMFLSSASSFFILES